MEIIIRKHSDNYYTIFKDNVYVGAEALPSNILKLIRVIKNPFRYIKDPEYGQLAIYIIQSSEELYYEYNGRKRLIGKFPR